MKIQSTIHGETLSSVELRRLRGVACAAKAYGNAYEHPTASAALIAAERAAHRAGRSWKQIERVTGGVLDELLGGSA